MDVLVLYYSRGGATAALAREVAAGVDSVTGAAARIRTVPAVSPVTAATEDAIPDSGPPYATTTDLAECGGLVMGSPVRFGNMAAALKSFLESTGSEWLSGTFVGKPAGVFTASTSLHGGQEATPLSMMLPLLHHGFLIVGVPYTEADLTTTRSGGSPYGAGHVSWGSEGGPPSDEERRIGQALGRRVASIALQMTA